MKRINEIDGKTLVEVFNDYNSSVGYNLENKKRSWPIKSSKKIPMEELYEAYNTKGAKILFNENILLIKDESVREALDLKPLNENNPTSDEIVEILEKGDTKKLEKVLQYCSDTTLEKVVACAIDLPVENITVANLIKSYSGKNILEAIEDKKTNSETQQEVSEETPRRRIIRE